MSVSKYKFHKYKKKLDILSIDDAIEYITNIGSSVNIIGAGEATHGQDSITKFRIKLFKQLVNKCGFTVFVLEDQYGCCELINQYINGRQGDPYQLLKNLSWYWTSTDMLELINWMREYNLNLDNKSNNKLEFKGMDIQSLCKKIRNDPVDDFVDYLNFLNNHVDQNEWVIADGFRDLSMFQVFMKYYDLTKKYFIYAHNYHVSKIDIVGVNKKNRLVKSEGRILVKGETINWLGCLLTKEFGSDYYSIGNIFNDGSYLETSDLVEQRAESGFSTKYKHHPKYNNFIIVNEVPLVATIDTDRITSTLNTSHAKPYFDIIINLSERPLRIL